MTKRMMELTGTKTVEEMKRAVETVAGSRELRLRAGLTTGQAYNLYNEDPDNYVKNLEEIEMKNNKIETSREQMARAIGVEVVEVDEMIEDGRLYNLGHIGSRADLGRYLWENESDHLSIDSETRDQLRHCIDWENYLGEVENHGGNFYEYDNGYYCELI